jgi:hypothetical protein
MSDPHLVTPSGKPRARSLGIPFGGTPGPWNAITDVPGVEVGYTTVIESDDVRTGVTGIHPRIHKAGVLVEQRGDDRYLLLARPSFAAYVAEWLLDGMLGLKADAAA